MRDNGSVCLSVREHISGTIRTVFTKYLCMLPMVVDRSPSGGVAICCALPVLWMTSRLHIMARNKRHKNDYTHSDPREGNTGPGAQSDVYDIASFCDKLLVKNVVAALAALGVLLAISLVINIIFIVLLIICARKRTLTRTNSVDLY